jgi:2-oxoglutarate ferredoxin oxidoreductase subunit alpha
MVEDVEAAACGRAPVHFFGKTGGNIPTPENIAAEIEKLFGAN